MQFPSPVDLLDPGIKPGSPTLHAGSLPSEPPGRPSWGLIFVAISKRLEIARVCNGEGNGNPLQYSCLENSVDRGAWWAAFHGVAQSRTRLKCLSMHACTGEGNGNPLQCSCLENPRAGEPGGLPSMGSHRVRNN